MKTVNLKNGDIGIPLMTIHYLTDELAVKILGDIYFHNQFDFDKLPKKKAIEIIKSHLRYQGTTVYDTWHEDTEYQEEINKAYVLAEEYITKRFPELKTQTNEQ